MKTSIIIESAKAFNVKNYEGGLATFGIKLSSKKQDGSYSNGVFINVKTKEAVMSNEIIDIEGFLTTSVYKDTESVVIYATKIKRQNGDKPTPQSKPKPQQNYEVDINDDDLTETIPF